MSNDPFPKLVEECLASWKRILPDYEFILWNTNKFDINSTQWTKQAFEAKKYAFASDYIRLYALYNYGGIYLDTDVEVLKSFNELLHLPYFIGLEQHNIIEAAVIGAEKHNSWIKDCMKYYEQNEFMFDKDKLTEFIIPTIMENEIMKNKKIIKLNVNEVKNIEKHINNTSNLVLFPFEYFSAKNNETHEIKSTPNTYTIHHFNNYWVPAQKKIRSSFKRKLINAFGARKTDRIIEFIGFRKIKRMLR